MNIVMNKADFNNSILEGLLKEKRLDFISKNVYFVFIIKYY